MELRNDSAVKSCTCQAVVAWHAESYPRALTSITTSSPEGRGRWACGVGLAPAHTKSFVRQTRVSLLRGIRAVTRHSPDAVPHRRHASRLACLNSLLAGLTVAAGPACTARRDRWCSRAGCRRRCRSAWRPADRDRNRSSTTRCGTPTARRQCAPWRVPCAVRAHVRPWRASPAPLHG